MTQMQVPEDGTVVTVRSLRVEKGPEQKAQRKERAAAIDVDSVNGHAHQASGSKVFHLKILVPEERSDDAVYETTGDCRHCVFRICCWKFAAANAKCHACVQPALSESIAGHRSAGGCSDLAHD